MSCLSPAVIRDFEQKLGALDVVPGLSLAPFTTFRIGGPAELAVFARSAEALATAVTLTRAHGLPLTLLGLGANVLIGDRGIRGVVILNRARRWRFEPDPSDARHRLLVAESGTVMQDLVLATAKAGLGGLEHYAGIPSSVGGALWQNLHFLSPAPERERTMFIAEVFERCDILTAEGERRTVGADYIRFGYDDSIFHHRPDVVLEASFRLVEDDPMRLQRVIQENLSWRGARHPWLDWHPSAGSIFKKHGTEGAGRLIDACGLKGFRIGGAMISTQHANIIVNAGGATAADVHAVIARAREAVQERFGITLQVEIGLLGE
ncbi:MAG TPA: UDP-N-acetylmuramate dehydrogenase [Gemmatimonadales bacterium]|nr:UDP-N-acetylmuramate dehydrogenase [Gemmatimonadales bacterium]